MPYNPNDPNYQTKMSRVMSFNDFEQEKTEELDELKKMKRNFKKRGELNSVPGERKHKYNRVTHKIDDLSSEEVLDKIDALEENHHNVENYMFFSNLKTIHRLAGSLLKMDHQAIDEMLKEHDWASDHIATSKDDVEEVFNWISSYSEIHDNE